MNKYIRISWISLVVIWLSACTSLTPADSFGPATQDNIVVGHHRGSTPEGCGPFEVAELVLDFFDALNRGNRDDIASFFGSDFQWYSVTLAPHPKSEPSHHVAYIAHGANLILTPGPENYFGPREIIIEELLDYYMQRRQQNERLLLREVSLTGGGLASMDISYALSRYADDLDPEEWGPFYVADGKGNVDCQNRKINVWSMAMTARPDSPFLIPFANKLVFGICPPTRSTLWAIVSNNISNGVLACTL